MDARLAPAESLLRPTTLLFRSGDGREETVQSMNRKMEDMLKEKVAGLSADLIQKEMCLKALEHHRVPKREQ